MSNLQRKNNSNNINVLQEVPEINELRKRTNQQQKGQQPIQQNGQQPIQQKGQQPIQQKGQQPIQQNGQQPIQQKGQQPIQQKGQQPIQQNGQQPIQQNGQQQRNTRQAQIKANEQVHQQKRTSNSTNPQVNEIEKKNNENAQQNQKNADNNVRLSKNNPPSINDANKALQEAKKQQQKTQQQKVKTAETLQQAINIANTPSANRQEQQKKKNNKENAKQNNEIAKVNNQNAKNQVMIAQQRVEVMQSQQQKQQTKIQPLFNNIQNSNYNNTINNTIYSDFYNKLENETYDFSTIYNEYKEIFNTFTNNNAMTYDFDNIYEFLILYITLLNSQYRENVTILNNIYTLICSIITNNYAITYSHRNGKKYIITQNDNGYDFKYNNIMRNQNGNIIGGPVNYQSQTKKHIINKNFNIHEFLAFIENTYGEDNVLYQFINEFVKKYNSNKNSLLLILFKSYYENANLNTNIEENDIIEKLLQHLHFNIDAEDMFVNFDDFFLALTLHNININDHYEILDKLPPFGQKSLSECGFIIEKIIENNYDLTLSLIILSKYLTIHKDILNKYNSSLYRYVILFNAISCFERQVSHESLNAGFNGLIDLNVLNQINFLRDKIVNDNSKYNTKQRLIKFYNYPFVELIDKFYEIFIKYKITELNIAQEQSVVGIMEFVDFMDNLLFGSEKNKNISIYNNDVLILNKNEKFEVPFNRLMENIKDIITENEPTSDSIDELLSFIDNKKIYNKHKFIDYHINFSTKYECKYEMDGVILDNYLLSTLLHETNTNKDFVTGKNYAYIPNLYIKYNKPLNKNDFSEIFTKFFRSLNINNLINKNLIIDIKLKNQLFEDTLLTANLNIKKHYFDIYIPYINDNDKTTIIALNDYLVNDFIHDYNIIFNSYINVIINSSLDTHNELYKIIKLEDNIHHLENLIPFYIFIYNYVRIMFYNSSSVAMLYIVRMIKEYLDRFENKYKILIPLIILWILLKDDTTQFVRNQQQKIEKIKNDLIQNNSSIVIIDRFEEPENENIEIYDQCTIMKEFKNLNLINDRKDLLKLALLKLLHISYDMNNTNIRKNKEIINEISEIFTPSE